MVNLRFVTSVLFVASAISACATSTTGDAPGTQYIILFDLSGSVNESQQDEQKIELEPGGGLMA